MSNKDDDKKKPPQKGKGRKNYSIPIIAALGSLKAIPSYGLISTT